MTPTSPERRGKTRPHERTCAVCQGKDAPEKLVRWVRLPDGSVLPDLRSNAGGRGAWVHPTPTCLAKVQAGLSRSFRQQVTLSSTEAVGLLASVARQRVAHLLGAARRQRLAAVGSQESQDAWDRGEASLLVVARDARASAELPCVREAIALGKASAWGDKDGLGRLFGRPEVGVLAILDRRLATALFDAIAMALLAPESVRAEAREPGNDVSTEVE